ncbi:hypothetical protein KEM52_005002, partial [Ascosphaera acerosa]
RASEAAGGERGVVERAVVDHVSYELAHAPALLALEMRVVLDPVLRGQGAQLRVHKLVHLAVIQAAIHAARELDEAQALDVKVPERLLPVRREAVLRKPQDDPLKRPAVLGLLREQVAGSLVILMVVLLLLLLLLLLRRLLLRLRLRLRLRLPLHLSLGLGLHLLLHLLL